MKPSALLFYAMFLSSVTFGQVGFVGYEKLHNQASIVEGEEILYALILDQLRFPDALRSMPVVSIVIACFEIDPQGKIIRFFSLNDTDLYFVSEINRIFSKTDLNWTVSLEDTSYFILPIEFRNVVEEEYETDYYFMPKFIHKPVTCFSTFPVCNFIPDSVHVNLYEHFMQMNKYGKALKELNTLINRQPFKEIFYIKKIRLYTYMGKIEEARIEQRKVNELFPE